MYIFVKITIFNCSPSVWQWRLAETVHLQMRIYPWKTGLIRHTCLVSVRTAESIDLDCVLIIKHFSCLRSFGSCSCLQHPITVYQYKCYCLILNWFLRIYHHTVQSRFTFQPYIQNMANASLISEDSSVYQ